MIRARLPIALVLLGLLIGAVRLAPSVQLDFSLEPIIESNPEQVAALAEFREVLPPRRVDLAVAVEWPSRVTGAELTQLAELEERLVALPEVESAVSLASALVIEAPLGVPMPWPVRKLVGDGYADEVVRRHPLLDRTLLSANGRAASLHLRRSGDERALLEAVEGALAEAAPRGATARLIGSAPVDRTVSQTMLASMIESVALEALVFAIVLPLLFRSTRGTLLPLLVVHAAIAFDLALHVLLDWPLSLIDVAIPGLVTILGLCDAVHMMHRFEEAFARTGDRFAAVGEMMRKVGTACFHTSFTTGIGFLSLMVARHEVVRSFGVKASMAVVVTYLTIILALPVALALWPSRAARPGALTGLFSSLRYGRPRLVLGVTALVIGWSIVGATRVRVESRWLEELSPNAAVVQDLHWAEASFTGLQSIEVQLAGDLSRHQTFAGVERLQQAIIGEADVLSTESYVQWIREALGQPPGVDADRLATGLKLMGLFGDRFPGHLVDRDLSRGLVVFRTGDIGTVRYRQLCERIEEEARALPAECRATVGGYTRMAHDSAAEVVTTMLQSFALSLFAITVFVSFIYRSWTVGLVSMLPNLLPILVAVGLNGWLEIPLRIGIVMIYSLGLGLAVDDSIHVLTRFHQERREHPHATVPAALLRTLRSTGRALFTSSLILALGALCYLPAELRSMHDVGILLTAIVVTALVADLWLLPVLIEGSLARRAARAPATPRDGLSR